MINVVIDLSHHQNHVDFNKLRQAGIVGVIHKATEGLSYVDPRYKAREELARAAGLLWGAYHFGTGADGSDQADHFLDTVAPLTQTLVCLDYEPNLQGPTMKQSQAIEFLEHVEVALSGRLAVFYTGAGMVGRDLKVPQFGRHPLWWAQYGAAPSRVPKATWADWSLWQYTDGAVGPTPRSADGVGFCDRDQFNGDMNGLLELWGVVPPVAVSS